MKNTYTMYGNTAYEGGLGATLWLRNKSPIQHQMQKQTMCTFIRNSFKNPNSHEGRQHSLDTWSPELVFLLLQQHWKLDFKTQVKVASEQQPAPVHMDVPIMYQLMLYQFYLRGLSLWVT